MKHAGKKRKSRIVSMRIDEDDFALLKLAIREGVSDRSTSHRLNLELIDSVMDVRRAVNRLAGPR